ncbi:MAG: immune inhibitor A, partial [Candidatus Thermoplasmatota archaeon]|nr:immune inhibitor A [Candidatus Thermoplasmatota archaeon]
MQKSIYRLAILALCIGFLVHSTSAMILSQGNIGGSTSINSDMQLLGFGKLGGGGHANWEITGEAAQRLREKAIIRYDTNGDGLLQKEELYPGPGSESSANLGFLSAVEFFSENTEYAGARIYGARPLSRDEGPDGWVKDIEGLLEVPASSTEPIRIRLLFSSDMAESLDQSVPLLSSLLADAVYRPFSTGGFLADDQSSYSHRDLTMMVPNTFWHQASGPMRVHNGTYSWRCGYPLNDTYPPGLADAMDSSVNLTGAVNPQISFWTKLMIGPGDRAEVMVKNRTSASWDVMDTYNSNIVGSTGAGYIMQSYDLSPYSGNIIDIRFLFTSDHAGTAEGWYLDDMMIGEFGPGIIFEDDFENPLSNIWHTTGWGRDNTTAHQGNWSLADSPGANYTSNSTSNALLGPIYFGGADSANLEFWYLAEIADIGDVFSLSASSDNSTWETLFSTNQSAAAWTQVQDLSLDDYLGGLYLNFSFSANETGEAGGIDLDGLMITATYPTYWSQDAEDFVGITLTGDVDHSEDLWTHDEGVWSCNGLATGQYVEGMDNELLVQPSLDWRFLEDVSVSFQYSGELNPGARLYVEMTAAQSLTPSSWTTVATIDSSKMDSDSTRWTDFLIDEGISQFIGQRYVRLRFRFQSDLGASTAMGISLRNIAINGVVYDGVHSMSHTHFQVGVSSFFDPQITQGSYFILRTPFGEIFTYSVTVRAGEESTDTIKFASFNILENPQFLFILFLLFSGLILHFPKRYFKEYKISMPYRYRILAKKAVVPTALSKSSVLAMAIFYFVPSLGGFLFVSGIVYIIIGAVLVLVSAAVSNFVYKAKIKEDGEMIPPERKETKPSPPPAPSTPIINVNVPEAKKRKKVAKKRAAPTKDQREYQCQTCGEIFTM